MPFVLCDSEEREHCSAIVQFLVPASSDSIAFGMISPILFLRFDEHLASYLSLYIMLKLWPGYRTKYTCLIKYIQINQDE